MLNNFPQFKANGTIGPMRFVIQDATADNMVLEAGVTQVVTAGTLTAAQATIIGVSQIGTSRTPGLAGTVVTVAAQAGDVIQLYGMGDVAPVQVGGTAVIRGDLLGQSGTTGLAKPIAYTPGTFGGVSVGAIALQSGATNTIILAQIRGEHI